MGFIKRLLGLEQRPGEPKPITEELFDRQVLRNPLPCFVDFYNLWCSSCQVMGGLLNEVGPQFIGKADFFKIDVNKNPGIAEKYQIRSVPTLIVFKQGSAVERHVGLLPLNPLKELIESHIDGSAGG
ncbi:MAG TPA: thioredoxin domain-containing protein [Patescibacteria group bacterium]|nr:thioredoxin domain-containing protein [Patescibacteria group bacterium]